MEDSCTNRICESLSFCVLSCTSTPNTANTKKLIAAPLQLSLASDKISVQRIPLLLLSLKLNVNEKEQTKTVTLELTREELDKLIATLEEVNSVRKAYFQNIMSFIACDASV